MKKILNPRKSATRDRISRAKVLRRIRRLSSRPEKHTTSARRKRIWKNISAPVVFSILENTEETLSFFDRLDQYVNKGFLVFLDISVIQDITAETILYLLSRLNFYKTNYSFYHIQGNVPQEPYCQRLLNTSGFYKYVQKIGETKVSKASDILSIECEETVQPELAYPASRLTSTT